ncbi:DUF6233 domain-containing protein [Streptomyces sp. NPDC015131]|uniref:DUF6233 domain-containing protein n=1 Tax=Streptomyces sp. NPDC015131 TaxID=3364941 RepID=UPI003700C541
MPNTPGQQPDQRSRSATPEAGAQHRAVRMPERARRVTSPRPGYGAGVGLAARPPTRRRRPAAAPRCAGAPEARRPCGGVSYETVPTRPLLRSAPSSWAWTVQVVPARGGAAARTVVHTTDCAMAGEGPELDLDQALNALRRRRRGLRRMRRRLADSADLGGMPLGLHRFRLVTDPRGAAWEVPDTEAGMERRDLVRSGDFSELTSSLHTTAARHLH